jgi:hypothetical protein
VSQVPLIIEPELDDPDSATVMVDGTIADFVGGRDAARNWGQGVPATCPSGGATTDSHGLSRSSMSVDPQVSKCAGDGNAAPQTSQADGAISASARKSPARDIRGMSLDRLIDLAT